jgi:hypothetical protein
MKAEDLKEGNRYSWNGETLIYLRCDKNLFHRCMEYDFICVGKEWLEEYCFLEAQLSEIEPLVED